MTLGVLVGNAWGVSGFRDGEFWRESWDCRFLGGTSVFSGSARARCVVFSRRMSVQFPRQGSVEALEEVVQGADSHKALHVELHAWFGRDGPRCSQEKLPQKAENDIQRPQNIFVVHLFQSETSLAVSPVRLTE